MSRPRLLADHDLNGRIIDGLLRREPAIELVRLRDVLPADTPDPDVLAYAARTGRVVVSHDINTMTAAARQRIAAGEATAGLVVARQSLPIGTVIDDLLIVWSASEAEEWTDRIVFLPL